MQTSSQNLLDKEKSFFIQGSAGAIEAKAQRSKSSSLITIILCHPHPLYGGTMENKVITTCFRSFHTLGANVVRFNYRGVGQSQGKYDNTDGETDDLISVCNWVIAMEPNAKIWLLGFSFGGYIAARAANSVNSQQLITIAPAIEHFDFDAIEYPRCPWLLLQGEADEIVPPQLIYRWVNKQENPPRLIKFPNTTHFFHGKLMELKLTLESEFGKTFVL